MTPHFAGGATGAQARGQRPEVPHSLDRVLAPHRTGTRGTGGGGAFLPATQRRHCPDPGSGTESGGWSRGLSWPITPQAPSWRQEVGGIQPPGLTCRDGGWAPGGGLGSRDLHPMILPEGAAVQTWKGPVSRPHDCQGLLSGPSSRRAGRGGCQRAGGKEEALRMGCGCHEHEGQDHPPAPHTPGGGHGSGALAWGRRGKSRRRGGTEGQRTGGTWPRCTLPLKPNEARQQEPPLAQRTQRGRVKNNQANPYIHATNPTTQTAVSVARTPPKPAAVRWGAWFGAATPSWLAVHAPGSPRPRQPASRCAPCLLFFLLLDSETKTVIAAPSCWPEALRRGLVQVSPSRHVSGRRVRAGHSQGETTAPGFKEPKCPK